MANDEDFPAYSPLNWARIKANIPKDVASPLADTPEMRVMCSPKELFFRIDSLFPELAERNKHGDVDPEEDAAERELQRKREWHAKAMETYEPMYTLPATERARIRNRYREATGANELPMRTRDRADRVARLQRVPRAFRGPTADGTFSCDDFRFSEAEGGKTSSRPTFDSTDKDCRLSRLFDPYKQADGPVNTAAASAEKIMLLCTQARHRMVAEAAPSRARAGGMRMPRAAGGMTSIRKARKRRVGSGDRDVDGGDSNNNSMCASAGAGTTFAMTAPELDHGKLTTQAGGGGGSTSGLSLTIGGRKTVLAVSPKARSMQTKHAAGIQLGSTS